VGGGPDEALSVSPHHLPVQLISRQPKPGHHRRHFGVSHRLLHFKPSAGNNPLITPTHQACVEAYHHRYRTAPVLALKRLQLPAQFIIGLQVGVVGAQQRHASIALEPVHQAIAQQHGRRVAPA
jgi:hypothetical protein